MSDATLTGGDAGVAPLHPSDQGAGWFGKVPALGDFVVRRLPTEFRDRCDRWLSAGMLEGQRRFGTKWTERFLAFPVWRFAWFLDGATDRCWAGLLAPGADRVGRLFPLVVAFPVDVVGERSTGLDALDALLGRYEGDVMTLLVDDDVDRFDHALQRTSSGGVSDDASVDEALARGGLGESIALRWIRAAPRPVAVFWRPLPEGGRHTEIVCGALDSPTFLMLVVDQPADRRG
jgi:type VI secretion system ImpM family protein